MQLQPKPATLHTFWGLTEAQRGVGRLSLSPASPNITPGRGMNSKAAWVALVLVRMMCRSWRCPYVTAPMSRLTGSSSHLCAHNRPQHRPTRETPAFQRQLQTGSLVLVQISHCSGVARQHNKDCL